ncbi:hypothetical protein [Nostoc sp.]|uniref:hypothetical protein n=1 Tax=Nostoc sp. TaxID=1180 RepID=UPI002FFC358E
MTNQFINEPTKVIGILQEQIDILKKQKKVFKTALDKETEPNNIQILTNTISDCQILIDNLGNEILQGLTNELKQLEPQLEEGLKNLEEVQQNINNTVNILNAAQQVTSIVARILILF